MKTQRVKIALSHVVNVIKEHANKEISRSSPGHCSKVSRYAGEILQTYFETKINQEAHQISDLASRIAHDNGRRTIRPRDMDHAIELLNHKQDEHGDIKLMELQVKRFGGKQTMTATIYYDPQADLRGSLAFTAYLDHMTKTSMVKTFVGNNLKELLSTIRRGYDIIGYTPIIQIDEKILITRGVKSC